MKEYTLVILAAGMGSRFGGLKQVETFGPNGEFIIDYSVYDAVKAGFNRVIFVIKKENEQIFKDTIGARITNKVKVEYAFQDLTDLPEGYIIPKERIKPLGNAHALYAARHLINGPYAVINADDFYGFDAYRVLMEFLTTNDNPNHYVSVSYPIGNILSENGSVKRGINKCNDDVLEEIIESKVETHNGVIVASPLDGRPSFTLKPGDLSSVNMFGFPPETIDLVIKRFTEFLDEKLSIPDSEYLMTDDFITKEITAGNIKVYVKKTTAKWYGVTYREDKKEVVNAINNYIKEGKYPKNLWE